MTFSGVTRMHLNVAYLGFELGFVWWTGICNGLPGKFNTWCSKLGKFDPCNFVMESKTCHFIGTFYAITENKYLNQIKFKHDQQNTYNCQMLLNHVCKLSRFNGNNRRS